MKSKNDKTKPFSGRAALSEIVTDFNAKADRRSAAHMAFFSRCARCQAPRRLTYRRVSKAGFMTPVSNDSPHDRTDSGVRSRYSKMKCQGVIKENPADPSAGFLSQVGEHILPVLIYGWHALLSGFSSPPQRGLGTTTYAPESPWDRRAPWLQPVAPPTYARTWARAFLRTPSIPLSRPYSRTRPRSASSRNRTRRRCRRQDRD